MTENKNSNLLFSINSGWYEHNLLLNKTTNNNKLQLIRKLATKKIAKEVA